MEIRVHSVIGTGHAAERAVIDTLVSAGMKRDRILYVCNRMVRSQASDTFGVPVTDPRELLKTGCGDRGVVVLGDLYPSERTAARRAIADFEGLVVDTDPTKPVEGNIADWLPTETGPAPGR